VEPVGAQMWLGAELGKKINVIRTEEALETGAQTVATACPFCTVMLEEGLQLKGVDSVKVTDVSELVAEAAGPL
jgi:Fe-S oxidoreductase